MLPPDNLPVTIPDVLIALIGKARELTLISLGAVFQRPDGAPAR